MSVSRQRLLLHVLTLLLTIGLTTTVWAADIALVANQSIPADSLSKSEVKGVFLTQKKSIEGVNVKLTILKDKDLTKQFLRTYVNKTPSQFKAFYKKLMSTGKANPPKKIRSEAEMISYIARTKGAIGYVSSGAVTDKVKIIQVVDYNVTGSAVEELIEQYVGKNQNFAGYIASSGSGGTLAAGYYLKTKYPSMKIAAAEALQCPTLLNNGYGDHRIEGIGDKHVPWIHDCKNTDFVIAVDDEKAMRVLRLFNEEKGKALLQKEGVNPELINNLDLLGISGVANILAAVKFAKYNELTEKDYLVTIATDSMQLYGSRIQELEDAKGVYSEADAERDRELLNSTTHDNTKELNYYDKKAIHNLKYFTWIEQQAKELKELNAQWYDHEEFWTKTLNQADEIDDLVKDFNQMIHK